MRVDVDPQEDMRQGLCSFCRKPVSLDTGVLNLYTDQAGTLDHPRRLVYPIHDVERGEPVAMFGHFGCGPDTSYWLALDRFTEKETNGEYGLRDHVSRKAWSSCVYDHGITLALELHKRLSAMPKVAKIRKRKSDAAALLKEAASEAGGVNELLNIIATEFDLNDK